MYACKTDKTIQVSDAHSLVVYSISSLFLIIDVIVSYEDNLYE